MSVQCNPWHWSGQICTVF